METQAVFLNLSGRLNELPARSAPAANVLGLGLRLPAAFFHRFQQFGAELVPGGVHRARKPPGGPALPARAGRTESAGCAAGKCPAERRTFHPTKGPPRRETPPENPACPRPPSRAPRSPAPGTPGGGDPRSRASTPWRRTRSRPGCAGSRPAAPPGRAPRRPSVPARFGPFPKGRPAAPDTLQTAGRSPVERGGRLRPAGRRGPKQSAPVRPAPAPAEAGLRTVGPAAPAARPAPRRQSPGRGRPGSRPFPGQTAQSGGAPAPCRRCPPAAAGPVRPDSGPRPFRRRCSGKGIWRPCGPPQRTQTAAAGSPARTRARRPESGPPAPRPVFAPPARSAPCAPRPGFGPAHRPAPRRTGCPPDTAECPFGAVGPPAGSRPSGPENSRCGSEKRLRRTLPERPGSAESGWAPGRSAPGCPPRTGLPAPAGTGPGSRFSQRAPVAPVPRRSVPAARSGSPGPGRERSRCAQRRRRPAPAPALRRPAEGLGRPGRRGSPAAQWPPGADLPSPQGCSIPRSGGSRGRIPAGSAPRFWARAPRAAPPARQTEARSKRWISRPSPDRSPPG